MRGATDPRQRIRQGLCVLALAGAAWALVLARSGGLDIAVGGLHIETHDWRRPLLVSSFLLTIVLLLGGRVPSLHGIVPWVTNQAPVRIAVGLARRLRWSHLAGLLAAATLVASVRYGTRVAGGADSYGYVSEASLWASGTLTQPTPMMAEVPWPLADVTLTPLGYRPTQDRTGIVPIYSPGLPMLMAVAQLVAGYCAVFWVVPLATAALVVVTYLLGVRLGSPAAGGIAAWLVATSPTVLYMSMNPMSDVPAAAAWATAVLLAIGTGRGSAIGAGLATAVAILIRPNLAPSAAAIGLWLLSAAWKAEPARRKALLGRLLLYCGSVLPGALTVAAVNWTLYGSPVESGYGSLSILFDPANVGQNARNYATWLSTTQTPLAFAGIAAILLPVRWLWPTLEDRSVVLLFGGFVLSVWVHYLFYAPFGAWWFLRFLLPCWPFILIGLAVVLLSVGARLGRVGLVLATVIALAVGSFGFWTSEQNDAFRLWRGERRYTAVASLVREHTTRTSVVFSMQHSGSLRHYAGRMTMRYDNFDSDWFDRAIAWLSERGMGSFLAVEDWELEDVRTRFAGQQVAAVLDAPPIFVYQGPARVLFYDLRAPRSSGAAVRIVNETYDPPTCIPPMRMPTLSTAR